MIERRQHRSRIPHEAVSLLLEAAAARSGATAAALADEEGLLLGGAGRGWDLEQLAAVGAACARASADLAASTAPLAAPASRPDETRADAALETLAAAVEDLDLYATPVRVGASTCYLTSLGARIRRQQDVAAGVARILAPWPSREATAAAR